MNYCTITDAKYKVRTQVLLRSMETHCQPFRLWVLPLDNTQIPGTTGISLSAIMTPALKKARVGMPRRKFAWLIKSALLQYILGQVEAVCYLDSDSAFFSSPTEFFRSLNADIAITPHRFSPAYRHYVDNGRFNAGFLFFRNGNAASRCLTEWQAVCLADQSGLLTEQKHLDQWQRDYGAVAINHLGINLAPWNQAQYAYSTADTYQVDGHPIVWYHFHEGLGTGYPLHPFVKRHLYSAYRRQLEKAHG